MRRMPRPAPPQATEIAGALNALDGVVPQIRAIKVGADVLGNGNWDVALVADFDALEALNAYQEHPAHQALLPMIRARVAERAASTSRSDPEDPWSLRVVPPHPAAHRIRPTGIRHPADPARAASEAARRYVKLH